MAEMQHLDTLKINVLTKSQFASAVKDPNQIYVISDEDESQSKLIGLQGQYVGFDKYGNAIAQNFTDPTSGSLKAVSLTSDEYAALPIKDENTLYMLTDSFSNINMPPYTVADEGKVLKIVNGKASWVKPN